MSNASVFTKIINRELPADIVFENERLIVIKDIHPDAPVHLLGITKQPFESMHQLMQGDNQALLWELFQVLTRIAEEHGIAESGYRLVTNVGDDAHQVVKHLHVHLLGGEKLQMKDPVPQG